MFQGRSFLGLSGALARMSWRGHKGWCRSPIWNLGGYRANGATATGWDTEGHSYLAFGAHTNLRPVTLSSNYRYLVCARRGVGVD